MNIYPLMTPDEVCKILRCSRSSLDRMIADNIIQPVKMRGLIRFREADVEELISAFRFQPESNDCQCDAKCECVKDVSSLE